MTLANQLRDAENERQEHISSLQFAHSQLSPNGSAPDELAKLVKAIEILSEGHAIHTRGLEDAANLSSAENKDLEERLAQAEGQLKSVRGELRSEKAGSSSIREALAQERSKVHSLRSELVDEQSELKNLRSKFAAGETGSEALKERVANEEQKVAELAEKLAVAASNVQSFEQEISTWKEKVELMTAMETQLRSKLKARGAKAKDLSQRIFSYNDRLIRILEQFGFSVVRQDDKLVIQRASKVNASTILSNAGSMADVSLAMKRTLSGTSPSDHYSSPSDLETLYWMSESDDASEEDKYQSFISSLTRLDADAAVDIVTKRYKDVEILARKYQKDSRAYREKSHRVQSEAHEKIAYRSFKEGDLALFLPTRNQATRPWAAFNVGAPHYFLREQDSHKLQSRDWLLARISKVEERIVDLSRSLTNGLRGQTDRRSINTEASDGASTRSVDDENPFELSDGLRWYMIDAFEEKPGAPTTPGLGKSTVAATNVDVNGRFGLTKEGKKAKNSSSGGNAAMATKTLSKSLDSRRSSSGSKKGHTPSPSTSAAAAATLPSTGEVTVHSRSAIVEPAEADNEAGKEAREDAQVFEEVRKDLLYGP
jgi:autophagy-related protein 11